MRCVQVCLQGLLAGFTTPLVKAEEYADESDMLRKTLMPLSVWLHFFYNNFSVHGYTDSDIQEMQ